MEQDDNQRKTVVTRLEDLTQGTVVRGITPGSTVTVVDVKWHGTNAVELFYKDATGRAGNRLLINVNYISRCMLTHSIILP